MFPAMPVLSFPETSSQTCHHVFRFTFLHVFFLIRDFSQSDKYSFPKAKHKSTPKPIQHSKASHLLRFTLIVSFLTTGAVSLAYLISFVDVMVRFPWLLAECAHSAVWCFLHFVVRL